MRARPGSSRWPWPPWRARGRSLAAAPPSADAGRHQISGNGPGPSRRRSAAGRRATALGWVVTASLAFLALAWLVGLDRWLLPASLGLAVLPLALAPAWLVTGAALAGRRWPLAITAGLVAVVHVAAVVPTLATSGPPPRGPGTPVRVVTANSSFRNVTPDTWAAELLALDADVLFVQEYAPSTRDALVRAGVRREYPFQAVSLLPFSAGLATFSRLPMRGTSVRRFDQDDFAGSVKVGDDLWLRVLNVHTVALPNQVGWRASFSHLERYVADEPTPLVAAGDFNATLWNQPMRALLDGPLRDAHDDRGRGLAATWPVGRPGPPFALLDHVLVTSSIDVRRISERTLAGSDHRAVVADLVVRAA